MLLYGFSCLFLYVNSCYLCDVSAVIGIFSEELCRESVICNESAFLPVVNIELAAGEYHFRFLECNKSADLNRSYACFLCLIAVSARM